MKYIIFTLIGLGIVAGLIYPKAQQMFGGTVVATFQGGSGASSYSGNSLLATNALGTMFISTGTPQLTVGSILATTTNATSTFLGGLQVETNTFIVDYSSNKVGISTLVPAAFLTVNGSGVVGTANSASFDIGAGRIGVGASFYSVDYICALNSASACSGTGGVVIRGGATPNTTATVGISAGISFFNGGNFGVGTTSPYAKLSVTGDLVIQHFSATSTLPTLTACGAGFSNEGSDTLGRVNTGTNTSGCVVTFSRAFSVAPICVVSNATSSNHWHATTTTTTLNLMATGTINVSNGVNYFCGQGQ